MRGAGGVWVSWPGSGVRRVCERRGEGAALVAAPPPHAALPSLRG